MIVVLGNMNQEIDIVEFRIDVLKTLALAFSRVRTDHQNVKATVNFPDRGQNRSRSTWQFHRLQTRLEVLDSQADNESGARDQHPHQRKSGGGKEFPTTQPFPP
jgi:hypothetical protein